MGKRRRLHREAVTEGRKAPFRASPNKLKVSNEEVAGAKEELFKVSRLLTRISSKDEIEGVMKLRRPIPKE